MTIYQQSKILIQDIFKLYRIEKAVVIVGGGLLDTSDGQNSFNPTVVHFVKFRNGKIQSGLTYANNKILIGDTVTCKLYDKKDPIFIEHNGENISPSYLENSINWIISTLVFIFIYFYTLLPFYQKYLKKT